jgi:hypothetical protein
MVDAGWIDGVVCPQLRTMGVGRPKGMASPRGDICHLKNHPVPNLWRPRCKALPVKQSDGKPAWTVEGVGNTSSLLLFSNAKTSRTIQLEQHLLDSCTYDATEGLRRVRFANEARLRGLVMEFN